MHQADVALNTAMREQLSEADEKLQAALTEAERSARESTTKENRTNYALAEANAVARM